MAEFNGKKFYGYTMENDPDLVGPTWNTKNFEFSCIRPETVQRAIEKVNSDVGASIKQKKSHLLNKLREKCGDAENDKQTYENRDIIEKHLSQAYNCSNILGLGQIHAKIQEMSNREKCSTEKSSPSYSGDDATIHRVSKTERAKGGESTIDGKNLQNIIIEEYQEPKPAWVEITEQKKASMQMFDLKHPPPPPPPFGYPPNLFQMPQYQYMPPSPYAMPNLGYIYDQQQIMENYNTYPNPYGDYDPNAYLVEDSDLEDEMIRREHYTKFCEKRPEINDALGTEDNESCAEFVNIAPQEPYTDMSCLKSTVPMRYSELSEDNVQAEIPQQQPKVIKNRKKAQIKIPGKVAQKNSAKKESIKESKKEKISKPKTTTFATLLEQERIISNQHAKATKTSIKRQAKRNISPPTPRVSRKPLCHRTPHDSYTNQQEYRNMNVTTVSGKSLEQLKAEKAAIFNKMSRTHERLIDALQQLRAKLLEVYVPESNSDRQRRNRNGFEFSVRFLRNFLYPLKGMIDTARNTSKEQFNSVKSNDACNRVAHIYSLFLQAVFTYSKQLRHFMIDQVPQKLTTLLEMLYSTTNMCLDKRLFDRNDAIVDCLLKHCAQFLAFLEDLHAQRFVVARESYRKIAEERHNSKFDLKMFMNDLNMYEPKLVPKRSMSFRHRFASRKANKTVDNASTNAISNAQSVQQLPHKMHKRIKQTKKLSNKNKEKNDLASQSTSDVNEPKRLEVDVPTQMQDWNLRSSDPEQEESHEVLQNLQNILQHSPNLEKYEQVDKINRLILNALQQSKYHHQSREILQPLLKSIEEVLDLEEDDSEIEKILKAFQMKISTLLNEMNFQHEAKAFIAVNETSELEFSSQQDEDESSEESDKQTDSNEEPSDKNNQNAGINNKEHINVNSAFDNDNDDNNNDIDEEDKDGQFYISGEALKEKRKTIRSQKSQHEPLVEIVDKSEADQLYSSDAEICTLAKSTKKSLIKPPSPYVVPLSRRSNKTEKSQKSSAPKKTKDKKNIQHTTLTASSNKKTTGKMKVTTVPPSPAMMRLKKHEQQSNLTERSKKNNLLKKRSHRNPMGSPPPPPTVSPSTSVGYALTKNTSDLHLFLSNTLASHKGCSVNIAKHEIMSSSELSHHEVSRSENEINLDKLFNIKSNSNSKSALRQLRTPHNLETKNTLDGSHKIGEESESDNEDTARAVTTHKNQIPPAEGVTKSLGADGDNRTKENFKSKEHGHGDQKDIAYSNTNDSDKNLHENVNAHDKSKKTNKTLHIDVNSLLKDRDQYLSRCIRNRLYTNPNFTTPWKILSRISHQLTNDIVKDVEDDFNTGVLNFVDDFLELETRI